MDITEYGNWDADINQYNINISSIFSYLIRECGKHTKSYNSDILYDIDNIRKCMMDNNRVEKTEEKNELFWIGFRDCGVDGKEFINERRKNENVYKKIVKISINKSFNRIVVQLNDSSLDEFNEIYKEKTPY